MKLDTKHVFVLPICEELNDLELKKIAPRFVGHTEFWSV